MFARACFFYLGLFLLLSLQACNCSRLAVVNPQSSQLTEFGGTKFSPKCEQFYKLEKYIVPQSYFGIEEVDVNPSGSAILVSIRQSKDRASLRLWQYAERKFQKPWERYGRLKYAPNIALRNDGKAFMLWVDVEDPCFVQINPLYGSCPHVHSEAIGFFKNRPTYFSDGGRLRYIKISPRNSSELITLWKKPEINIQGQSYFTKHKDDPWLILSGLDQKDQARILVLRVSDGKLMFDHSLGFVWHRGPAQSFPSAVSADHSVIAHIHGTERKRFFVHRIVSDTWQTYDQFHTHTPVVSLAISKDNARVFSLEEDRLTVWNISGDQVCTLSLPKTQIFEGRNVKVGGNKIFIARRDTIWILSPK